MRPVLNIKKKEGREEEEGKERRKKEGREEGGKGDRKFVILIS